MKMSWSYQLVHIVVALFATIVASIVADLEAIIELMQHQLKDYSHYYRQVV